MGKIANAARACRETWERTCFRSDHLWLRVALPQWCFKRSLNADLFPRNAVQDNLYMWSLWVSRLRLGNEAFRSAHRYLVIHHSDLDDCTPISQSLSAAQILQTVLFATTCSGRCFTAGSTNWSTPLHHDYTYSHLTTHFPIAWRQLIPVNDRGPIWPDHLRSGESWCLWLFGAFSAGRNYLER